MIWRWSHSAWLLLAASGMSCAPRMRLAGGWEAALGGGPPRRVLNIAHRGARSLAPENTLAAGRKAFAVGADGWEIDVQMSRDGQMVVMHDDTLVRTTNARDIFPDRAPWTVCDFTLDELRQLDAGAWFSRDDPFGQIKAGAVSAEEGRSFAGERIPTLQEVLRLTRDHGRLIDIEIKQMPRRYPDIVEKVVRAVEADAMVEHAAISSFDHSVVIEVKRLNPRLMAGPIAGERIGDPARYVREVLGGDTYFAAGDVLGARSVEFAGTKTAAGSGKIDDLNLDDIRSVERAGVGLFVWTINDEPLMRTFLAIHPTAIVTDFPQILERVLKSVR